MGWGCPFSTSWTPAPYCPSLWSTLPATVTPELQLGRQTAGVRRALPRAELSLQIPRPPTCTRRREAFKFLYKQGNLPGRSVSGFSLMQSSVSQHLCYTLGCTSCDRRPPGVLPGRTAPPLTSPDVSPLCFPRCPVTVTSPISAVRLLGSGQWGRPSRSSLLPTHRAA